MLFCISFISAAVLPIKDYDQAEEKITIYDWNIIGKIFDIKLAEYKLEYNTDACLIDCFANGTVTIYTEEQLFSDIKFMDRLNKQKNLDYKIYYGYDIIEDKDLYKYVENKLDPDNPLRVFDETVKRTKTIWKEYKGEILPAGTYYWSVEGKKSAMDSIDWITTAYGKELSEWAWWDGNFQRKKGVYMNLSGHNTNDDPQVPINVTYESTMQNDFDDLRFTNAAEDTEYPYYIADKVDGSWALVWVRLDTNVTTTNQTLTYMYYNDSDASAATSGQSTFYLWDDFDSANTTKWNEVTGSLSVSGGEATIQSDMIVSFDNWTYDGIIYELQLGSDNMDDGSGNQNPNSAAGTDTNDRTFWGVNSNNRDYRTYNDGSSSGANGGSISANDLLTTVRSNGSAVDFYQNNGLVATVTTNIPDDNLNFGMRDWGGGGFTVQWARVRSWNDTEIVYGFGAEQINNELSVTLTDPDNNFNTTNTTVNFQCLITDETAVINASFYINDTEMETNTSGFNGTYVFSYPVAEGNSQSWQCQGCDASSCINGTARTFSVDRTIPTITNQNISNASANGVVEYAINGDTVTFNWNVTDTNLDDCWYQYNVTNTTVTCADNTTVLPLDNFYDNNLTFYANDSFGNENSVYVTWDYALFYESATFNASTTEGTTETYVAYVATNGTAINLASLQWNGTNYTGTISASGNNYTLTRSIAIPDVAATTSLLFNWSMTAGGLTREGESNNVSVAPFSVDNCSTNSEVLYNFTIVDEETQDELNESAVNTTANINLQVYTLGRGSEIENFSQSFNQTNPFAICLNSTAGEYNIDVEVQYDADGYASELYHIQNDTLNSADFPTNITLYDLDDDDNQPYKLIIRDSTYNPSDDTLVYVDRKYIDEGEYKTVEIPITDNNGETTANLVSNDVIYRFRAIRWGQTILTFDNVKAVCLTPAVSPCEIDFNAFASGLEVPDWETSEDFNYTLGYNETDRTISSTFAIPSGTPATVVLNVTREDALGTAVCTDTLTSASGTLSCTVPANFGNATALAVLTRDGDYQAQGQVKIDQDPSDIYGVVAVFLSFFLMITLIGAGVSDNPVFTIIFFMVGVIALFALNLVANNGFIGGSATILYLIIAVILVLVKGARRS